MAIEHMYIEFTELFVKFFGPPMYLNQRSCLAEIKSGRVKMLVPFNTLDLQSKEVACSGRFAVFAHM